MLSRIRSGDFPRNAQHEYAKKSDRYYLVDDCDGTLLSAALLDSANKRVDISDDDNNWAGNNPSVVTSYWGLRGTYDYYNLIFNRRSYDGKNGNMTIFNDPNMDNDGQNASGGSGTLASAWPTPAITMITTRSILSDTNSRTA